MLAFTTPGALIGLATLAVPIALHLWSRRAGRPQRIGNIALFAAAPPPTTRSPRLDDVRLLLLRCGVLAALALALAGPEWRAAGGTSAASWALVDGATAADPRGAPLLDSLRAAGADIRPLGTGPVWSMIREADRAAPPGTRLIVVAPNRGAEGERPVVRAATEWLVPPVGAATPPAAGAASQPARTVLLYADASRREDARYVAAALRAAAAATARPAAITQRDAEGAASPANAAPADWIVWLAARPVPDVLLDQVRRGATLLSGAADGETRDVPGRIRLTAATAGDAPLVTRRSPAAGGAPVWTDDAGRALLTVTREGAGTWLRFHSRFHPSWGALVLHPAFPEAMAALWAGSEARRPDPLAQPVAVSQLLPAQAARAAASVAARADLYHAFWLAGVLLFLLERWVARRRRSLAA